MSGLRLNQFSILISIVGIVFIAIVNFVMHEAYLEATGETLAVFEVGFLYKSKYFGFGLLALIFPCFNFIRKYNGRSTWTALLFALFTLVINVIPFWQVGTGYH